MTGIFKYSENIESVYHDLHLVIKDMWLQSVYFLSYIFRFIIIWASMQRLVIHYKFNVVVNVNEFCVGVGHKWEEASVKRIFFLFFWFRRKKGSYSFHRPLWSLMLWDLRFFLFLWLSSRSLWITTKTELNIEQIYTLKIRAKYFGPWTISAWILTFITILFLFSVWKAAHYSQSPPKIKHLSRVYWKAAETAIRVMTGFLSAHSVRCPTEPGDTIDLRQNDNVCRKDCVWTNPVGVKGGSCDCVDPVFTGF